MNNKACERYLEEPEVNAAHLAECEECRRLSETLDLPVQHHPLRLDALPLAPWEGAAHRAWSLVIGGALGVAAIAIALFIAAGASPVDQVRRAVMTTLPVDIVVSMAGGLGGALRSAPASWQIALGIGFVAVNAALFALLRRAPKGIDV